MSEHAPSSPNHSPAAELAKFTLITVEGGDQRVTANRRWGVTIKDPYPGDPTPIGELPIDPNETTQNDVVDVIDRVTDARGQFNRKEIDQEAYDKTVGDAVGEIADEQGIDHLAFLTAGAIAARREMRKREIPKLDSRYRELSQGLLSMQAMSSFLGAGDKKSYDEKVRGHKDKKEYNLDALLDEPENNVSDSPDYAAPDDPTRRHLLGGITNKTKEFATRKNMTRALGIAALAGYYTLFYAATKGAVGPEHATVLYGNMHGSGQALTNPLDLPPKQPRERSDAAINAAEIATGDALIAAAVYRGIPYTAFNGIKGMVKKRAEQREHAEHAEHEHTRLHAEHTAFKAMVDPDSPQAVSLVDALKHPSLLDEILHGGAGVTNSTYARDVVARYARLIAPKVGGNAEAVREHLENLGIETAGVQFGDVATRSGGRTVDVTKFDDDAVTSVAQGLAMGHLNFGNLPPAKAFLNDPKIQMILDPIFGTQRTKDGMVQSLDYLMRRAPAHPYTKNGGPTVHQYNEMTINRMESVLDILSENLPTDDARGAAIAALRLQDVLENVSPAEGGPSKIVFKRTSTYLGTQITGWKVAQRVNHIAA